MSGNIKRILYAEANYEAIIDKNGYFVDKTKYIARLENVANPIFLRPRRFGKSLFCSMLECYYSIRHKDRFHKLFGNTFIGKNPTPLKNSCLVLHLDFSIVETGDLVEIQKSFNHVCNLEIERLVKTSNELFKDTISVDPDLNASANLQTVIKSIQTCQLPPLFIIIDEYDNFANQLIMGNKDIVYHHLIEDGGFLKTFFKTLKEGRQKRSIQNIFITGVLPMTIDELASAYNIGTFITLVSKFENMLGFTQAEVDTLLDEVYRDYQIDSSTRQNVNQLIKNQYDGFRFTNESRESLYNSTILIYFLDWFCEYKTIPQHLTDLNLKTDISWVKRLCGANPENAKNFVTQLTLYNSVDYDDVLLTSRFNVSQFFKKDFFPISFYYLGMLTRNDYFSLKLPNLNMRQIFVEYFNELHQIDVSTKYQKVMRQFLKDHNLDNLFSGYWDLYISQLPEAIFQQVNENFYRTTFYEICSRYLSNWFTFNVERSYPKGRSDLEFVGKYHESCAGIRIVIEFKYYSNTQFAKFKTSLSKFQLQKEDTEQIKGYIEGLKEEYPEAIISSYVIYCVGNIGFKVFSS
ncbi:MAG: AAA family ATPase [Thermodesulfobacteriota bacterium]|nr:AAA family ATPase [Thermodesulfobacteriota bacterium]